MGVLPSLSVVLVQEMARFNALLSCIGSSLVDVQRALRGELSFSKALDDVASSMTANAVPRLWSAMAYPSLASLQLWMEDLIARVAFFARWLKEGQPRQLWLSAFFFPQGLLTAVLQQHARTHKQPIDALTFQVTVEEEEQQQGGEGEQAEGEHNKKGEGEGEEGREEEGAGGVLIRGLYCEGGRWNADRRVLDEAKEGEVLAGMPVIRLTPSLTLSTPLPGHSNYLCPLYKTRLRAGELSTTGSRRISWFPWTFPQIDRHLIGLYEVVPSSRNHIETLHYPTAHIQCIPRVSCSYKV